MEPANLRELTTVYGPRTWDLYADLDESSNTRGPDELFDQAAALVAPGGTLLDAGCRDATHLIELVDRLDVDAVGVEPVALHVERAKAAVSDAELDHRITIHEGSMSDLPIEDASIDLVWCRDVFEQVDEPVACCAELVRVSKPGGPILLFTTVAADRLHADDRAILRNHMGNVDRNLERRWLESEFERAGLTIEDVRSVGTDWREHIEERAHACSTALLRLARLRRRSPSVIERHGRAVHDHVEANLHWEVFQFLGKLDPLVYVLRTPTAR